MIYAQLGPGPNTSFNMRMRFVVYISYVTSPYIPLIVLSLPFVFSCLSDWRDGNLLVCISKSIQPRPPLRPLLLEYTDRIPPLHGQCDIIQTVEQAMPAEWIRGERNRRLSIRSSDLFLLEINLKFKTSFGILRKLDALFLGNGHGKHPILHRVVAEDIGKAWSNYTTDTKVVPG